MRRVRKNQDWPPPRGNRQAALRTSPQHLRREPPRHRPPSRRSGGEPHRRGPVLRRELHHRGHGDAADGELPALGGPLHPGRLQAHPGDGRRQDPQPVGLGPAGQAPAIPRRRDGCLLHAGRGARPGARGGVLRPRERCAAGRLGRHRRTAGQARPVQRLLLALGRPRPHRVGEPAARSGGGGSGSGLRAGHPRRQADGRHQRLAGAVRRRRGAVLPLPSGAARSVRPLPREPGLPADPRPHPPHAHRRLAPVEWSPQRGSARGLPLAWERTQPAPDRGPRLGLGRPRNPHRNQPDQRHA